MARTNTARKVTPQNTERMVTNQHQIMFRRPTPLQRHEKINFALAGAWMFLLTLGVVATNINQTHAEFNYQTITDQVTKVQTRNANLKEEIGTLGSRTHLMGVAKQNGLTMNKKNVRNVIK